MLGVLGMERIDTQSTTFELGNLENVEVGARVHRRARSPQLTRQLTVSYNNSSRKLGIIAFFNKRTLIKQVLKNCRSGITVWLKDWQELADSADGS